MNILTSANLDNSTLKEVDKIRLNTKFDTQFQVKNIKKELLLNRYNNNGKLQQLC